MPNRTDGKKGDKMSAENTVNGEQEQVQHGEMVPGEPIPEVNHQKKALEAVEIAQKEILYIRAEFENYKKRIQREQEQAIRFSNKAIILDLLNLSDLFDRAILHGKSLKEKNDKEVTNFVSGVEMTHKELAQLMQRFGLEFVGTVNDKFDPEQHEAIAQIPSSDGSEREEEYVAEVIQKGCKLHGKIIKPARVAVGRR